VYSSVFLIRNSRVRVESAIFGSLNQGLKFLGVSDWEDDAILFGAVAIANFRREKLKFTWECLAVSDI
jgi:hypothetical protein